VVYAVIPEVACGDVTETQYPVGDFGNAKAAEEVVKQIGLWVMQGAGCSVSLIVNADGTTERVVPECIKSGIDALAFTLGTLGYEVVKKAEPETGEPEPKPKEPGTGDTLEEIFGLTHEVPTGEPEPDDPPVATDQLGFAGGAPGTGNLGGQTDPASALETH
jgi:hypothetical protein